MEKNFEQGYDAFITYLVEKALEAFEHTAFYEENEKVLEFHRDCCCNVMMPDAECALADLEEALAARYEQQGRFLYEQGMRDILTLFGRLGQGVLPGLYAPQ